MRSRRFRYRRDRAWPSFALPWRHPAGAWTASADSCRRSSPGCGYGVLFDARRRLRLSVRNIRQEGVLGMLRRVDTSFDVAGARSYRAVNRDSFMVALIAPAADRKGTH